MNITRLERGKPVISALVAGGLLVYLLREVGLDTLVSSLRDVDKGLLALALALHALSLVAAAGRWSSVVGVSGHSSRIRTILHFMLLDKVANAIFPTSAVGVTVRTYLLEREYRIPKARGFATIVMDYGTDITMTFLLAIPCFMLMASHLPASVKDPVLLSIVLLGIAIAVGIGCNTGPLHGMMNRSVARTRLTGPSGRRGALVLKGMEILKTFRLAIERPRLMARAFLFAFGSKGCEVLRAYVLFAAFDVPVPFALLVLVESAWIFVSPFMVTPGGIGAVESGRLAVYTLVTGLSSSASVPVVFVERFITFWLMIAIGALALLVYRGRDADHGDGGRGGLDTNAPFIRFPWAAPG